MKTLLTVYGNTPEELAVAIERHCQKDERFACYSFRKHGSGSVFGEPVAYWCKWIRSHLQYKPMPPGSVGYYATFTENKRGITWVDIGGRVG